MSRTRRRRETRAQAASSRSRAPRAGPREPRGPSDAYGILDALGAMLWLADRDGHRTFFNRAWLEYRGRRLADEVGNGWLGGIHADDRGRYVTSYETALATPEAFAALYRLRGADGRYAWVSEIASPLASGGRVTSFIGSCSSISEGPHGEDVFGSSEPWYRILLGNLPVVTWCAEVDGKTTFISPNVEGILGFTAEHLHAAGRALRRERIDRRDLARVRTAYRRLLTEGAPLSVEYRFQRRDGTWIWLHDTATAVSDAEGRVRAYGVSIDITARKIEAEIRSLLMERLLRAQEEERGRIARELHDDTAQWFASLLVGLGRVERATTMKEIRRLSGELRRQAVDALAQVRRLAEGWRPPVLDDVGLGEAIQRYVAHDPRVATLQVIVQIDTGDGDRLPPQIETALYRIAQEALTNAANHARAHHASVTIERDGGRVRLRIADDGEGFDVDAAMRTAAASGCLGLHGMRERAQLLDGAFTITSTRGVGTVIEVDVPMTHERRDGA